MQLQRIHPHTHAVPQGPSGKAEAEALTNGTWDGGFDFSTCFEDAFAAFGPTSACELTVDAGC